MLTGIFGHEFGNPIGNLKTYTMTLNGYLNFLNGSKVFANYKLNFPFTKIESFNQLLSILQNTYNVTVLLDEFHIYLSGYDGISRKNGSYEIIEFAKQTRKRKVSVFMTGQSIIDVHKSLRRLMIRTWLTRKLHENYLECYSESCRLPHILEISELQTLKQKYLKVVPEIFNLYNTEEVLNWNR